MKHTTLPRAGALAIGIAALIMSASGAQQAAAESWPERPLTMVVGFGVGGSADRAARAVASFLPDELGQPISVVNRPGAGSQLAATFLLSRPDDGYTLFYSAISPYLATSVLAGNADYSLDDFAFINSQWTDWDMLAVHADTPYQSLAELLEAIRDNPGRVRGSMVFGSSGHLSTLLLLDALSIPHENLNMVSYDSGAGARTAVAGGQVDFTILGAEGSEGVREFIRPIALFRDDSHDDWDAPPVNEALAPLNAEIPIVLGSMRGMAVAAGVRDNHPDRFEKLVDAYKAILERDDVRRFMRGGGIGHEWLGPEETTRRINMMNEVFTKYREIMTD